MGVLSKLTISSSGDVGQKPEQLKKWVENNGGKWVPRPTKGLTHLICSKEHWKQEVGNIQSALKIGAHIVSYDWLEDSLQGHRKLAEKKYTWAVILKQRKQKKTFLRMGTDFDTLKFKKGSDLARDEIGSGTSSIPHQPSSRAKGGFFVSAMEDLKQKREARLACEAKERTQKPTDADMATQTPASPSLQHEPIQSSALPPTPPASSYITPPTKTKLLPSTAPVQPATKPSLSTSTPPVVPTSKSRTTEVHPPIEKLTENHHIYLDRTGFEYSLKLLRTNLSENSIAQYHLRLYESNTTPHTYATFIRYAPARRPPATTITGVPPPPPNPWAQAQPSSEESGQNPLHTRALSLIQQPSTPIPPPTDHPFRTLLSPLNSDFQSAFTTFRAAFQETTLLAWEDRLDTPNRELQKRLASEQNIEPFVWKRPDAGLGVGDMPSLPASVLGLGSDTKKCGVNASNVYMRPLMIQFNLPGTRVPLSDTSGSLGVALDHEARVLRKEEREKRGREREDVEEAKKKRRRTARGQVYRWGVS